MESDLPGVFVYGALLLFLASGLGQLVECAAVRRQEFRGEDRDLRERFRHLPDSGGCARLGSAEFGVA